MNTHTLYDILINELGDIKDFYTDMLTIIEGHKEDIGDRKSG